MCACVCVCVCVYSYTYIHTHTHKLEYASFQSPGHIPRTSTSRNQKKSLQDRDPICSGNFSAGDGGEGRKNGIMFKFGVITKVASVEVSRGRGGQRGAEGGRGGQRGAEGGRGGA